MSLPSASLAARARAPMRVTVSAHPFDLNQVRRVEMPAGLTLAQMVAAAGLDPVLEAHAVARVGGAEIPRALWPHARPLAGNVVEIGVRPANGDGGNKVLRSILQIAVFAVAVWVGGPVAGAIGGNLGKLAAAVASATVAVAGNLAINALVPPPGLDGPQVNRRPSVDGARNEARPWAPVPIAFGRHRVFPPLQGQPVKEIRGDDVFLRYLVTWGPMPVEIVDLKIGETAIDEFEGLRVGHRLTASAAALTIYTDDPHQEAVGATLDTDFTSRTSQLETDELSVILAFPAGLGGVNSKGKPVGATVTVQVQYRAVGAGSWTTAPVVGATTRAKAGEGFFRTLNWPVTRGQYEVQVRRTTAESTDVNTADAVVWDVLTSTRAAAPVPEPLLATTEIEIKATDELSGYVDAINAVVTRRAPQVASAALEDAPDFSAVTGDDWTTEAATRNPADQALFALRGPHRATPVPDDRIDWPAWAEFWAWCDDEGFTCDVWLDDAGQRLGDLMETLCATGRGRPLMRDGKWSVVIDRPRGDLRRQMFTAGNVEGLRVVRAFPADVHALRVAFPNQGQGWREDERIVYADGYDASSATKIEELSLPGLTDPDLIYRAARFYWAGAVLQTERYLFRTDVESLAIRRGDPVAIAHHVMLAGVGSARVTAQTVSAETGLVTGLTLSGAMTFEAGKAYGARWREVIEPVLGGAASLSVAASAALTTSAGETSVLTLTTPISVADAPAVGALVAVGEVGKEVVDALVKEIRPGPNLSAEIECVAYAAARFDAETGTIPTFATTVTSPFMARPPAPTLVGSIAAREGIALHFALPAALEARLAGFEVSYREAAADGAEAPWARLPTLRPDERLARLPAGLPERAYDVRVVAVDADERRSLPLVVPDVAGSVAALPAPTGASVTPTTRSHGGASLPLFLVTCDAAEDPVARDLIVSLSPAGAGAWELVATASAFAPTVQVAGIAPGASYDVRLQFRDLRGVLGAAATVAGAVAPNALTALEALDAASGSPLATSLSSGAAATAALDASLDALEGEFVSLAQSSAANLLDDPEFAGGAAGWTYTPPEALRALDERGAARGLALDLDADGAGEAAVIVWPGQHPAKSASRYQASVDVTLSGVASLATLRARFRDAAGVEVGAPLSFDTAATGERAAGLVTAPAGAATLTVETAVTASGAGALGVSIARPLVAAALASQVTPDAYVSPGSTEVARIREALVADADRVVTARESQLAASDVALRAVTLETLRRTDVQAVAQRTGLLETRVGSAESSLVTQSAAITDLDASKAEASDLTATAATVAGLSATTASQATSIADLQTGKAEASALASTNATVAGVSASVTSQAAAIVDLQGRTLAYLQFVAGVDGGAASFRLLANNAGGTPYTEAQLVADKIKLSNPVSGQIIDALVAEGGNIRVSNKLLIGANQSVDPATGLTIDRKGGYMRVEGAGFGADGDLLMWAGPERAVSGLTKTNGVFAIAYSGAYLGAAPAPGQPIVTADEETSTAGPTLTVEVTHGDGDTSNGNTITVSYQYEYQGTSVQPTSGGGADDTISATIKLYRRLGAGGGWTEVASQTVTMSPTLLFTEDFTTWWTHSLAGSWTYSDTAGVATERGFRASLTTRTLGGSITPSIQRLTVGTTEAAD